MGDSQIIEWLQEHAIHFRLQDVDVFGRGVYIIEWIDDKGMHNETRGISLRDCVRGAVLCST